MALSSEAKFRLQVATAKPSIGSEVAAAIDAVVTNAKLSPLLLNYVDVTLTSAQIKALNTTPITLVAAPGAGVATIVTEVFATLVYGTATYACNASGASLKYTDGSGAAVGIALTQAFIQSASGTNALHVRGAATALVPVANAPIVIQAATSDPTTGDSLIKIRVFYRQVALPL